MPQPIGLKEAIWNLVERMCPNYQAVERARSKLEVYKSRHENLKGDALDSLMKFVRRMFAQSTIQSTMKITVAHAGLTTREASVKISVGSTSLSGHPDIVAVFSVRRQAGTGREEEYVVIASVEVKSTRQAALESASIYQAISYAYILYTALFPQSVKIKESSRASFEASRVVTQPHIGYVELTVKADMTIDGDSAGLVRVIGDSQVDRVYLGFLAYDHNSFVEMFPVFTANKGSVTLVDGLTDPLNEIILPAIQGFTERRPGEKRYVPGPWCVSCAKRSSCPAFIYNAPRG